ncbi:MAG TPA: hypothetical protein VGM29_00055 [Polyangiaceae bacterium]
MSSAKVSIVERQERVAAYLLDALRSAHPHHWRQGKRQIPLANAGEGAAVRVFAEQRVRGVSELALRGLSVLGTPFPAVLTEQPATAVEILHLQARGARIVTLLPPDAASPPPHDGPLAFTLHDLCHLAKFSDRACYDEQVGLFRALEGAFSSPLWQAEERTLDGSWQASRDSVSADMNGSAIFLFAVLKMKLKMAARRRLAARTDRVANTSGPLSHEEEREFAELLAVFLRALGLEGALYDAAIKTSARRDSPAAATLLCRHFAARARQP